MAQIARSVDAGVLTETASEYGAPFHIVKLVLPGGTSYLSEGPQVVWNGTTLGVGDTYLAGRLTVKDLSWTGEAGQSCMIQLYNEQDNAAAALFIANQFSDATATVWLVYQKVDTTFTLPVLYAKGTCEEPELAESYVQFQVVSQNLASKFMPNSYVGEAGFNHLPFEGNVVFWNNGTYVLERQY